jgi:hypothetical protein
VWYGYAYNSRLFVQSFQFETKTKQSTCRGLNSYLEKIIYLYTQGAFQKESTFFIIQFLKHTNIMNRIVNNAKTDTTLRIRKQDINANGEIFPHILLELLENSVLKPLATIEHDYDVKAKRSSCVYKVDIIGKAISGDELKVFTQLGKFDGNTAILNIQIVKKDKKNRQTSICKASFSYKLENNLVVGKIAS